MKKLLTTIMVCALAAGCTSATQHQRDVSNYVSNYEEQQLTVAAVQRSIKVGMSGAEVLVTLGSPNIISTDEKRQEVWVYDRVGTEYVHSESGVGLISLVGAASSSVAGGIIPTYSQKSGATRRSQRTLTIIVRFDGDKKSRSIYPSLLN
jgi:outer membrane protein assembly factor BamE (lipoprotein component of BamABCDE complex)